MLRCLSPRHSSELWVFSGIETNSEYAKHTRQGFLGGHGVVTHLHTPPPCSGRTGGPWILRMLALTVLLQRRSHSTIPHSGITTCRHSRSAQLRGYLGLLPIYFSLWYKVEKDENDETDLTILNHKFDFISLLATQDYGR